MTGLSWMCIWVIDMATWFLMLTSETMTAILDSANIWSIKSLSLQIYTCFLSLFFLFKKLKEKWLEKISISLFSRENLLLRELKEWKILFNLLLASTIEFLMLNHCLRVNFSSDR